MPDRMFKIILDNILQYLLLNCRTEYYKKKNNIPDTLEKIIRIKLHVIYDWKDMS